MLAVASILFWLCLVLLFYSYIGYGLLICPFILIRNRRRESQLTELPAVSLVIAGHNEAGILKKKISNTLALNYPADKLQILFVSDGSTDESIPILQGYGRIQVIEKKERGGKAAALNTAVEYASADIIVFSDANSMLNPDCLVHLISHFNEPKTGGVAGEKKILAHTGVGEAEGLYWKYESILKKVDASFYSVLSATGELFALRKSLYTSLPEDTILDDFWLSLQLCLRGYRIAYEPNAFSVESPSSGFGEEMKRKIRIAAGAFQVLERISWKDLLKYRRLSFQFFSRRWLRWVASPWLLPLLFLVNLILIPYKELFFVLFLAQIVFYVLAAIGFVLAKMNKHLAIAAIPFYFLFMNYCMAAGWLAFRQKKHTVLWEKAKRDR